MVQTEITNFKNGIFVLNTRRFGFIAEVMIKQLFNCVFSKDKPRDATKIKDGENKKNFDLYSETYGNIEVKFSRVLEVEPEINEISLFDLILNSKSNIERIIESGDEKDFDCNIQQIKPKFFHTLFYGLFFKDKVQIYKISYEDYLIKITDPKFSGSDKQHQGNEGEGQFHIKRSNLSIHKDFFVLECSYKELFDLFQKMKKETIGKIEQFLSEDINKKNFNNNSIYKFLFREEAFPKEFNKHIEKISNFSMQYYKYNKSEQFDLDFLFNEFKKLEKQAVTRKKTILKKFAKMYSKENWLYEKSNELEILNNKIKVSTSDSDIEKLYNALKSELNKLGGI